jgi:hypothetical protein
VRAFVIQASQPNLPQVIRALGASSRLACRLNRGQQQSDQDADDRDDHEQFNKREACWPPGTR